ncbi:MAG: zinc-binding dehydrogenase [Burkholderiales bacterium]
MTAVLFKPIRVGQIELPNRIIMAPMTRSRADVAGTLRVVQGGRYCLDQAAEAHRALESRRTTGKVILIP